MSDLAKLLDDLGLGFYAHAFAQNDIDIKTLPLLTQADLKAMGLPLGSRRKLQSEIARLTRAQCAAGAQRQNDAAAVRDPHRPPERRQLTVMFCDLVGSTAMSARLDPEDLTDVMNGYRDACKKSVDRFGGFVARFVGDGILAYFGYPSAHEDDAERALRCGLSILESAEELNATLGQEKGVEIALRIGAATGPVIAGDIFGGDQSEENAVVGEAPNIAARIQAMAAPNTLVVAPGTRRLARGQFEYSDLGRKPIKGIDKAVRVWQVTGVREVETRFAARTGSLSPFVGRAEELCMMFQRLQAAGKGDGGVILVTGEAGIGKSRLIKAFAEQAAGAPDGHAGVQFLQCSPSYTTTFLHPIIKKIGEDADFRKQDTDIQKLGKLQASLHGAGIDNDTTQALFAELLGIKVPEQYRVLDMPAKQRRPALLAALRRWLFAHAAEKPLILVFEDAQWIDPTTQELLNDLVYRVVEKPVLLIISSRPGYAPEWVSEAHVTHCSLSKIDQPDARRIISAIASEGIIPDKVVERIFLKTEGSPLFIEEMTKGLLESGLLTLRDGRYVDSGAFSSFTIPDTIYGPLRSRLDQLGEAKKTAQIGSVIGREFPFRLLLRASGLTPARLSHDLERLTRSGLVLQTGTPPESVYSFKHALIQEAAYQALLKTTRRELHLAIASALQEEEGGSGKVAPEILAQHFASGGDPRSAIRFWRLAARLAFERSALTEAERHLECALETIGELDDCLETRRLKLEVITQLGSALRSTRGYAAVEIESLYLEARALCQQIGETPERFNVEWALMQIYLVQGKLNKVNDAAIWLFSYAAEHDDRSVRMDACLANGMAKLHQGNIADACTYLKQSVALYRPDKDVPRVPTHGQDPGVFAQGFYHWTLWFLGHPDKARAKINQTVARAREISHTFSLVSALTFAVRVHHCLRDSTAVKTLTEELVGLSHANGYTYYEAGALIHQGWALAMEDEAVRGLAQMCEALAVLEKNGTVLGLRGFLIQLAEGYMRLGMKEEVLRALDKAEREGGSHCWDAEVYRVRGEVHAGGDLSERQRAEQQFSAGLEIARRQGARSLELRTATRYARALQQWGREGEAVRLLGPCLAGFNEGWGCADLIEAAALAKELRQMSGG